MSNFWKIVFGSCLGSIFALVALFCAGTGLVGVMSIGDDSNSIKANSVLQIKVSPELAVPEKTNNAESEFSFKSTAILGLTDIQKTLAHAKTDPNIKGIQLEMEGAITGQATTTALRRAIEDFRSSGKFVVAYGQYYMQKDYYLATAADKIYINPGGMMDFRGYSTQITFFKNLLDRLDVKVQVFYAGQFKSATEPFRYDKMSEPNRLQVKEYITDLYDVFLDHISKSRNIPVADLKKYANDLMIRNTDDAVNYRLVDAKGYRDDVINDMKQRMGLTPKDKINLVSLNGYYNAEVKDKKASSSKDKIAVVYAEGTITMGEGAPGEIAGNQYSSIIRKIRQDDDIKAIVLRINSGGGSSLASDDIHHELLLAKQAGKKIVVSMGDVAASGGYYIAAPADTIYAEPNSITGSIGVFSMIPSLHGTLKNKLGITFDTVRTGKYSAGFTVNYDLNANEQKFFQQNVEKIYDEFLGIVSEGRKMSKEQVHAIAQGRVWTGRKAQQIGLVDRLGTLDDAIACAARMVGVNSYRIKEYPAAKEPFEQFMEKLTGKNSGSDAGSQFKEGLIQEEMGELYPYYQQIKAVRKMSGIQMRMPYSIEVK